MGLHGTVRGNWVYSRRVYCGARLSAPVIGLAQSFNGITCFWRALRMTGVLAALADKWLWEFGEHFGACYRKGGLGSWWR